MPRTWETLTEDRTRLINRMKGLLTTQGVQMPIDKAFPSSCTPRACGMGRRSQGLQERLAQDWAQLRQVETQLRERRARATRQPDATTDRPRHRAVADAAGHRRDGRLGLGHGNLRVASDQESPAIRRAGGVGPGAVSKWRDAVRSRHHPRGNTHVRRVMVQLAWVWLQYQPPSALAQWYQRRFGGSGKRLRRIGIVALARKLLIALWRYLETGVVPEGAQLKPMEG